MPRSSRIGGVAATTEFRDDSYAGNPNTRDEFYDDEHCQMDTGFDLMSRVITPTRTAAGNRIRIGGSDSTSLSMAGWQANSGGITVQGSSPHQFEESSANTNFEPADEMAGGRPVEATQVSPRGVPSSPTMVFLPIMRETRSGHPSRTHSSSWSRNRLCHDSCQNESRS